MEICYKSLALILKWRVLIYRRGEDLRHELEQRRRDDSRYSTQGDGHRYDRSMDYRTESDRWDTLP